ncbi:MAG TPA: acylneuraminate cytidylyltransferase family protein [Pyrinomonadaceae bacterium]|nr:acylneuraminate cytidylyltransferase family protein [Pyrinomonadaceae bacterium]
MLGLIPARGGSKGVQRKNARLLNGKPLISYTAAAALAAKTLSRVVLSTEDDEIARIGRDCGLEVPFIRPAELARDDTPMLPVVQHALSWLEHRGQSFDAVCLLQPTNPLRRSTDIDACVQLLELADADSVLTVLPIPTEHHPSWAYLKTESGFLRLFTGDLNPVPSRQELPTAFHREGSVYVTRRRVVMEENSLYGTRVMGHLMNGEQCINIDTGLDWERAEALLAADA